MVGDDDEEEDEMYKDKGSLPIEKVRNFREFSLLWSNPPPGIRENQMKN